MRWIVAFVFAVFLFQIELFAQGSSSILLEEYVPRVIFDGRIGIGPGEFGEYLEEDGMYLPSSMAVNSSGDIYVLDVVNERIQKFDSQGKYLKSIMVESFSGERREVENHVYVDSGSPNIEVTPSHPRAVERLKKYVQINPDYKTVGIDVFIGVDDVLFYRLKRSSDGRDIGEVWKFKDDELISKENQEKPPDRYAGVSSAAYVDSKVDANVKEADFGERSFVAIDKKNRILRFQLGVGEEMYGYRKATFDEKMNKWAVRVKWKGKIWDRFYDSIGELLSISEVPKLSEFTDSKGNWYYLDTSPNDRVVIRKNELVRRRI